MHVASNEYCVARQRTRKREGEFRSIDFIVGGKVWNMDRGTGMHLRKVCLQCSTVIHARRSICECGHAFTLTSCNISLSIIMMSCLVLNMPHYVL